MRLKREKNTRRFSGGLYGACALAPLPLNKADRIEASAEAHGKRYMPDMNALNYASLSTAFFLMEAVRTMKIILLLFVWHSAPGEARNKGATDP